MTLSNLFNFKDIRLHAKFAVLFLSFFTGVQAQTLTTDTYTTVGNTDWVVPACVTSVTVRVWGAGGGGGGASNLERNGGGGGGGAYCTRVETVTPGETLRIIVGGGGAGGISSGSPAYTGGTGGVSEVQHLTGAVVFCRAAGGVGGQRAGSTAASGAGGAGGAIANNIPAGTGFRGGTGGGSMLDPVTNGDIGGGGGGGAGSGGNGGNGNPTGVSTAGLGSANGGGNGGVGGSTNNGNPGVNFGGGGGGAATWNSNRTGGAGAQGRVTITYTATGCEPPATMFAYSPAGSYNWVVPACVNFVTVEAWGGGGGGGGNIAVLNSGQETCTGAGGGGGGGYAARTYAVVPGQSYTIVVGAGGTAGIAGTNSGGSSAIITIGGNGGNGGNSTFNGPATIGPGTLTGTGGAGGFGTGTRNTGGAGSCALSNGLKGNGFIGLNGTVNYKGGNGADGLILSLSTDRSGGAGGAAGPGGDGGNAPVANLVGVGVDPPGGNGDAPGGNGGTGRTYNTTGTQAFNGINGNSIGGGGGGSLIHRGGSGTSTAIGGTGAIGEVRLTYNTACPLPVELMHFGGENKGQMNHLAWITASERINDYFTLERSVNGVDWEKVIDVKGAGTTHETQNYSFEDRGFTMGAVNYYRLSQTDIDGTQEYVGRIIPLNNRFSDKKVVSRYNAMGQEVGADAKGVVITLFEDGTIDRTYVD